MKRWLPSREALRRSRWLGPIAHRLDDDRLWHLERASVARAVAIGLFFGLLIPFAQLIFAVSTAVWLRAHVTVAAASTLISNPLTVAPLYWAAYRLGSHVLGRGDDEAAAREVESRAESLATEPANVDGLWATIQSAGLPLVTGLSLMAVGAAAIGFALVWLLWRPRRLAD